MAVETSVANEGRDAVVRIGGHRPTAPLQSAVQPLPGDRARGRRCRSARCASGAASSRRRRARSLVEARSSPRSGRGDSAGRCFDERGLPVWPAPGAPCTSLCAGELGVGAAVRADRPPASARVRSRSVPAASAPITTPPELRRAREASSGASPQLSHQSAPESRRSPPLRLGEGVGRRATGGRAAAFGDADRGEQWPSTGVRTPPLRGGASVSEA